MQVINMCVVHYTHIFFRKNKMEITNKDVTLSTANQHVRNQAEYIKCLESEVTMLKKLIAEETAMRYALYKKIANTES